MDSRKVLFIVKLPFACFPCEYGENSYFLFEVSAICKCPDIGKRNFRLQSKTRAGTEFSSSLLLFDIQVVNVALSVNSLTQIIRPRLRHGQKS